MLVLQSELRVKKSKPQAGRKISTSTFHLHYTEERGWTFFPFKIASEGNFHSKKQRQSLEPGTVRGTFHRFDQSI